MAPNIGYPINMNKQPINNAVYQRLGTAPASPVAGQYYVDTNDGFLYKRNEANSAWEIIGAAETATSLGNLTNGLTAKTTPVDADMIPLMDSSASNVWKKLSWANLKATLITYLGTLNYLTNASTHTLTNKTFDANGTGNAITNIETADFAANIIDNDSTLTANSSSRIATQQATKAYIDGKVFGLTWKEAVRVATTANGTLATAFANGQTVDGVVIATNDRIALKNQSTGAENGIYIVQASGAPVRSNDADTGAELKQATFMVQEGTSNADTQWTITNNGTITVGSTSLTFGQIGAGSVPDATTGTAGKVFLATSAEAKAKTSVANKAVDPVALTDFVYSGASTQFGNGALTQFDFTHSYSVVSGVKIKKVSTNEYWEFLVTETSGTNVRVNSGIVPTTNEFEIVISGK